MADENYLPARVNQHVSIIRLKDQKRAEYTLCYLQFLKPYLLKLCRVGGTRNALTKQAIGGLPINFVDNYELVGRLISDINAKIDLNNRINTELESLARTIYDYWFLQFDFPDEEGRPYRSSGGAMRFDEPFGREVPVGWEVRSLAEITIKIQRGVSPKYTDSGGTMVLNQKCIRDEKVNFSLSRRNDESLRSTSKKLIQINDILVNSTGVGTLGRVAAVSYLPEDEITVDSHVTVVRPDPSMVNPHYLNYFMCRSQPNIVQIGTGSTGQTELSRIELGKLDVLLPSQELQDKFQDMYLPMINQIAVHERQNHHLSALRDWLLPLLMSGQVRVGEEKKE